jgi:hypothetical protein
MAVRLSFLCTGHPVLPGRFLVVICVRFWIKSRAIMQLEGLGQLKSPMTSSGIEPMTFQTNYATVCLLDHTVVLVNSVSVTLLQLILLRCILKFPCHIFISRPPLWSSGQSSWLQIQIFWEVVDLERGPLSLVSITEELFEWKSSGSGLGNRINGCGDTLRWPRDTLYPQKLALTPPPSGGRSVGIVRLRTKSHWVLY